MVLLGVPSKIYALLTDSEGEPLQGEKAAVKVVKDSDGSTVVEGGEATSNADGVADYELAAQTSLDRLTAIWTVGGSTFTTYEEIVGSRLCSLASVETDVSSESLTEDRKRVARDIAEQFLEDECNVAFRPRYAMETLDGPGTSRLRLGSPKVTAIRSVTIIAGTTSEPLSGEELTETRLLGAGGVLWRERAWPEGVQNIRVSYEHGFTSPPPQASRVAAILARHIAVKRPSNLEDRATTYSTDDATYSLIQPGVRGMVTALPEVNAFIESWQFPEVV